MVLWFIAVKDGEKPPEDALEYSWANGEAVSVSLFWGCGSIITMFGSGVSGELSKRLAASSWFLSQAK